MEQALCSLSTAEDISKVYNTELYILAYFHQCSLLYDFQPLETHFQSFQNVTYGPCGTTYESHSLQRVTNNDA